MIFQVKEKIKNKIGDIKTNKKFAILPTRINSTTIIWLEKYYTKYRLCTDTRIENFKWCNYTYWKELDRWI